jgi:predicted transposase YbfD/YdcC
MQLKSEITITEYFSDINDPRIERSKRHKLIDIITISICAVICGADTWEDIELFGDSKYQWFKEFLELPYGIPSHDTFSRVFARIDPQQFQTCFINWVKSINKLIDGDIISIDGKALRHSFDTKNNKGMIHVVSAWLSSQKLVLGQVKVDEKSNEITAIPELLKVLCLKGCVVTIDAIGCQKEIVKQIVDQGGDYVITLKKNQGSLYDRVKQLFEDAIKSKFQGFNHDEIRLSEQEHGREETRFCITLSDVQHLIDPKEEWSKMTSVGMINSMRKCNGKTTLETRYFISCLPKKAKPLTQIVRSHWNIENQLHWTLDIAYREDDCRIRKDNAAHNFAILRHISLNLLNQEKNLRKGIRRKRNLAGWDNEYLIEILTGINQ